MAAAAKRKTDKRRFLLGDDHVAQMNELGFNHGPVGGLRKANQHEADPLHASAPHG